MMWGSDMKQVKEISVIDSELVETLRWIEKEERARVEHILVLPTKNKHDYKVIYR